MVAKETKTVVGNLLKSHQQEMGAYLQRQTDLMEMMAESMKSIAASLNVIAGAVSGNIISS